MSTLNNKDFRSTFFTMKQSQLNHYSKEKSEEADVDSVKVNL